MSQASDTIPVIDGIVQMSADYQLMLCDVWGVLHNGRDVFAGAIEACGAFRAAGGTVVLISNSPRPCGPLIEQLDGLGVPRDVYDAVVTSGDVTRSHLSERGGARVFHLGPERDKGIFEGLDVVFAEPDDAEIVVCSGLFDDTSETPDDYGDMLSRLRDRALVMICANPDLMVERGETLVYCAGALAQAYERLGGEVIYAGKPHLPIYQRALAQGANARGGDVPLACVVAIGDGLETDMVGAARAGIDALFVASGLHVAERDGQLDEGVVRGLFAGHAVKPIAALSSLRWS